ncbi:MAG: membrane protein insertase YidC [Sphaerochaeta sp.]
MDKKTVLAIILMFVVITVSMAIQTIFFPPATVNNSGSGSEEAASQDVRTSEDAAAAKTADVRAIIASTKNNSSGKFVFETDLYEITFDTAGASVSSLMLKEHASADREHVDIIFKGENDHNAFLLYFGDDISNPITDNFSYTVEGNRVIFTNDYTNADGQPFTLIKTYEFKDGEYLFAVTVDVIGGEGFKGINVNGYSYTLAYEPQVGPSFTQMKNSAYDYRKVYVDVLKDNGKLKKTAVNFSKGVYSTVNPLQWISVTSKYFTVVALPENNNINYKYTAVQRTDGGIAQSDSIYLSRPASGSDTGDTVYFYAGPQLKKYLNSYYSGMDNAWGLRNTHLDSVMESGSFFGWLETALKWVLNILYKVIPNYGIGIILLTIIIKIVLWPLTKKSTDSTAKMSALGPKQKELQEKYKDNPQKLNQEIAALYKEEGVSPLGGCLPMLLQFPIILAMYGLLNKHFELRGAMFIPGWITDLSVPETVATLSFNIPFIGNEIHILPVLYTASMIFSMKITQNQSSAGAQGQSTMKFMTYGMPILFFFILYSAPSGLLLYWSVQNVLSIIQQFYTNSRMKKNPKGVKKEQEEKVPEAVRKYQEKLKRIEENKARAAREQAKNNKKK